ncbi:pentapeptide repeat-containing protein, partial [Candidatus Poribacteria bacterium]|nr:pentapeptide repeat-containing protein [Candidatus Poribacteria bacterium]
RWADLTDADLRWAEFTEADLTRATTETARYNTSTRFPEGYDPAKAGMIQVV